jgi:hypothetical protein
VANGYGNVGGANYDKMITCLFMYALLHINNVLYKRLKCPHL